VVGPCAVPPVLEGTWDKDCRVRGKEKKAGPAENYVQSSKTIPIEGKSVKYPLINGGSFGPRRSYVPIGSSGFFHMLVVFNMFTAVAEAAAFPAVSKFHTRMRQIGNAASCAAMKGVLLC
jgi:hypothetical protein